MNLKKKLVSLVIVAVIFAIGTGSALAGTKSKTISYEGVSATASLSSDFGWASLKNSDSAKAITKFTGSNGGYRVAVRLEAWTSKNKMGGYKYQSSGSYAEQNYSWSDVYSFQSRHSIDNSSNTTEHVVKAFDAVE